MTENKVAVTVPVAVIRSALHAAANSSGRYAMDGILIAWNKDAGRWQAKATDGHLGAVIDFEASETPTAAAKYMIPLDIAKQIKAAYRAVQIIPGEGDTAHAVVIDKFFQETIRLPLGSQSTADSFPPLEDCRPEWTNPEHEYTPFPAGFHLAAGVMKKLVAVFAAADSVMHFRAADAVGRPCAVVGFDAQAEGIRGLWTIAMPVNIKKR